MSILSLQFLYERFAGIRSKDNSLASIAADVRGDDWNTPLCQDFPRDFYIPDAEMIFIRTRVPHDVEQAAASENFGAKLFADCSGIS
jgi:hypothetical protein